jgi:hypothetical protein
MKRPMTNDEAVQVLATRHGWFANCARDGKWGIVILLPGTRRSPFPEMVCIGSGSTLSEAVADALSGL